MNKSAFVEKMMASDKFASKKEAETALSVVLDAQPPHARDFSRELGG